MSESYEHYDEPTECYGCGADGDSLSIYNVLTGRAWCCSACRQFRLCDCGESR